MTTSIQALLNAADQGEPIHLSGVAVRSVRQSAGIDATALAAAVGVCERTLLGFERGERAELAVPAARLRLGRILRHLTQLPAAA